MTKIINIAGNSGAGKSVIALNLSIALTHRGNEVILLDSNIYSPDIANYSDISPNVFFNEYLDDERKIEETITQHPAGMKVIPSISEEEYNPKKHMKINQALLSLIGKSEIILVDSFSHNPATFSVIDGADETIFVTNDDYPSIVKTKEFINKMDEKGMNVIGIILNKRKKDTVKKHIEGILNKPVLAEIPHDEKITESLNKRQPHLLMHPNSNISKTIRELAGLLSLK